MFHLLASSFSAFILIPSVSRAKHVTCLSLKFHPVALTVALHLLLLEGHSFVLHLAGKTNYSADGFRTNGQPFDRKRGECKSGLIPHFLHKVNSRWIKDLNTEKN